MKTITLLLTLFMVSFCQAQSSVFVLVDVSGSGSKYPIKAEAQTIVRDLCLGKFEKQNYNPNWQWLGTPASEIDAILRGNGRPLIDPKQNGYLMIMPFGVKDRYKKHSFRKIDKIPSEINNFFDSFYPTAYTDNYTFDKIAKAKAASIAKDSSVQANQYYLIEVSDQLTDEGSLPPNYTKEEKELIAAYGTKDAKEVKLATLSYEKDNKNYQIIISKVEISNLKISPSPPIIEQKSLSLIRPRGSRSKPMKISNSGSLSISWKCLGCKKDAKYKATIRHDKNSTKPISRSASGTSTNVRLEEPGLYKVTVSTSGVQAQTAYVEVASEGGNGVFLLLLILAFLALAYYLWQKRQNAPIPDNNPIRMDKRKQFNNQRDTPESNRSESEDVPF